MIGQLRGKLLEKQPPSILVDVNGVGYCLSAPLSTFFLLPELGQDVVLRTHMVVREDAHLLYGFYTREECTLFQALIKVNGVGPKIALAILSGLSVAEFMDVVASQTVARLQRVPGIGSKTAQRILVEMQDRLPKLSSESSSLVGKVFPFMSTDSSQEAIEALMALGYKHQEATKAVGKVQNKDLPCEQIIREALQGLAKV